MSYTLTTLDQQRSRELDDELLKALLAVALASQWIPLRQRIQDNTLRLDGEFSATEARELAAALERGLQTKMGTLPPPIVMALLETIGVLRHGAVRFLRS